jgi:hypothetical protein
MRTYNNQPVKPSSPISNKTHLEPLW